MGMNPITETLASTGANLQQQVIALIKQDELQAAREVLGLLVQRKTGKLAEWAKQKQVEVRDLLETRKRDQVGADETVSAIEAGRKTLCGRCPTLSSSAHKSWVSPSCRFCRFYELCRTVNPALPDQFVLIRCWHDPDVDGTAAIQLLLRKQAVR